MMTDQTTKNPGEYWEDVKRLLRSRGKLILVIFLATAVPAVLVSLSKPPTYRVAAKLMFEQNRRLNMELSSNLTERASRNIIPVERLNSQVEVIRGNHLMHQLVEKLGLARGLESPADIISQLQRKLQVRAMPASTVIEISYEDSDPKRAENIVNTLAALFQGYYAKAVEGQEAADFYQERYRESELKLRERYESLNELRANAGIDTDIRKAQQNLQKHLQNLKLQLDANQRAMVGKEGKVHLLMAEMQGQPENIQGSVEFITNPNITALQQQLTRLEMERVALSMKYTDDSREMKDKLQEIAVVKNQLQEQDPFVEGKKVVALNPIHEDLQRTLTVVRAELEEMKNFQSHIVSTIEREKQRLDRLNRVAPDLIRAEYAVAEEEKTYSWVLDKLDDVRFFEALNKRDITSVNVIQTAEAPSPNKKPMLMSSVMGTGMGALLALGLALILEFLRPRIIKSDQITEVLRLPLLASIGERKNGSKGKNGHV